MLDQIYADDVLRILQEQFSKLYPNIDIKSCIKSKKMLDNKRFGYYLFDNPLFYVMFLKNNCRVSLKKKYEEYLPKNFNYYSLKSQENLLSLDLEDIFDLDFFREIDDYYRKFIDNLCSFDMGCCSRYVECSDAKHCVTTNPELFVSCTYRRNLDNGRIFYGKNKNM